MSLTLVVRHNDQLNYAARETSAGCRSPSPLVFGLRNGQLGSLMKKLLLASIPALILIPWLFALPLTALIFQKGAELAKEVTAWNKQCGDKPSYDDACMKKRYQISAELGKFVALVNDELDGLRDISPDASNDFVNEINGRRKIMELISRHTPGLTGRGFPYLSLSHQPLKNRNGPSFSTVAHTPRFRRFPLWAGFSDISFERPKRRDVLRCQQGSDSKSLGHSLSRSAPRPASAQNDSIIFAAMRFAGLISFAPVFQKIRRVPSIAGAVNRTCQSFRPGRGGCRQNFRVVQRVGMSNFRSFTSAPLAQLAEQVTLNHAVSEA